MKLLRFPQFPKRLNPQQIPLNPLGLGVAFSTAATTSGCPRLCRGSRRRSCGGLARWASVRSQLEGSQSLGRANWGEMISSERRQFGWCQTNSGFLGGSQPSGSSAILAFWCLVVVSIFTPLKVELLAGGSEGSPEMGVSFFV